MFTPYRKWLLVLILSASGVLPGMAQQPPCPHVRNFAKVSDSIYRGGEPSDVGMAELGAMGIKIVVDLREPSGATHSEKRQVEKLGMRYVSVPMGEFSAPTKDQIEQLLALLIHPDANPLFIHCRRGKDRTGTVIACYRIQHDHWTNREAQAEANQHGMSSLERAMRSYIAHFKALQPDQLAPDGRLAAARP